VQGVRHDDPAGRAGAAFHLLVPTLSEVKRRPGRASDCSGDVSASRSPR
jgi:hypothetical protein